MKSMTQKIQKDTTLVINGPLSMESAMQIRVKLIEAFKKVDQVVFHVDMVQDVSFACLQLLCSTCRYAMLHDKGFKVVSPRIDDLRDCLVESGFVNKRTHCIIKKESCSIGGILSSAV